jgi:hypothetical protein
VALAIETELAQPQSHNLTDPLIYLLHCSEVELGNFELTKLSEIRNLQAHLRDVQETIFEIGNQVTLARLVRMRGSDDMRRILETRPPDPVAAARAQIRRAGLAPGETRERPALPPGEAHRNAAKKYQATHIENGLCSKCPAPLARNSVFVVSSVVILLCVGSSVVTWLT